MGGIFNRINIVFSIARLVLELDIDEGRVGIVFVVTKSYSAVIIVSTIV
jgi:hypothetical protein